MVPAVPRGCYSVTVSVIGYSYRLQLMVPAVPRGCDSVAVSVTAYGACCTKGLLQCNC